MLLLDIATKCAYDECSDLPSTGLSVPSMILAAVALIVLGWLIWYFVGDE